MSNSLFRCAVKYSHFLSGDHPWRYDGEVPVTRFGSPPVAGTTQTTDRFPSAGSALALLMPSIVPSNESTWSLLLRVTAPVFSSATALLARSNVHSLPLPLKISVLP